MILNFDVISKEIEEIFETKSVYVLATSSNDRVAARSISCINFGLDLYFQTDKTFFKCFQISKNNSVALCVNNIQIEGKAEFKGHPLDSSNKDFIEKFKKKQLEAFKRYSSLENNIVIKVRPEFITLWKYIENEPCRDFIDLRERKSWREWYLKKESGNGAG